MKQQIANALAMIRLASVSLIEANVTEGEARKQAIIDAHHYLQACMIVVGGLKNDEQ